MIELLNTIGIENISNSVFSIENLLVAIPFFILSFFTIKKVISHRYTIIGFMFGCIVVPFSGGFFALLNSNTILTIFLFLFLITFVLYKLKISPYKLLIYPIFMLIIVVLILYAHFIFPILLSQSILEFYLISAFIYALLYLIIGFFLDRSSKKDRGKIEGIGA